MITVILRASDDAAALGRLLAALTPGAVDGLVRDVAVLGATGPGAAFADEAGATLYPVTAFADAVADARGEWLAAIPLPSALATDWIAQLAAHVARQPGRSARLTAPGLFAPGRKGWLVPKSLAASAGEQDLQRLARRSGLRLAVLRRS